MSAFRTKRTYQGDLLFVRFRGKADMRDFPSAYPFAPRTGSDRQATVTMNYSGKKNSLSVGPQKLAQIRRFRNRHEWSPFGHHAQSERPPIMPLV
jgi:hypothetical protein